jgi:hypothetical protein
MKELTQSIEAGKKDAERYIRNEQINYDPFIGISDLHLIRKAVPISFDSFKKTINEMDPELWSLIEESASRLSTDLGKTFNLDGYAAGFAEGVAAVWEKIRDKIL